jgi:hypothetical protein
VHQLLKGLKESWEAIDPAKMAQQQAQTQAPPPPKPYDPLAPTTTRLVKA